jgi:hypothetical protein
LVWPYYSLLENRLLWGFGLGAWFDWLLLLLLLVVVLVWFDWLLLLLVVVVVVGGGVVASAASSSVSAFVSTSAGLALVVVGDNIF